MTESASYPQLRLGTAPDSWGVWFPDDPRQVPWPTFLDEVAAAGYEWIELGPYGYLPTDPAHLQDELGSRGLKLSGGAVFSGLHRGAEALQQAFDECRTEARLLTALQARHLVSLPQMYSDLDGAITGPTKLTDDEWTALNTGMSALARMLAEEFDVDLVFHPHADSHVDTQEHLVRFMAGTDPQFVKLCLDTGHISYCGGDNLEIINTFPDRIGYVHLKQVDPRIKRQVDEQGLTFAPACVLGVMTEPPDGIPAMAPVLAALAALEVPLFAIVEQDMYPPARRSSRPRSPPAPAPTSMPAASARAADRTDRPRKDSTR
jgi:inosose dehydratase